MGGLLGGALILSLAGNAYLFSKKSQSDQAVLERNHLRKFRDSMQIVMNNMADSLSVLANFKDENNRLTNKVEELEGANNPRVMELMGELNRLRIQLAKGNVQIKNVINTNKPLSEGDQQLMEEYKSQILELGNTIAELKARIDNIGQEKEEYCKTLNAGIVEEKELCTQENSKLKDRVLRGSALQFGVLQTIGIVLKGKQKIETYRAREVEKLKIAFDVLENPFITQPLNEEITILVIDPDGNVVSLNDDNETLKQSIFVDSDMYGNLKVIMYYPPDKNISKKLKKGKYHTELYARDKIKQKNYFELD